MRTQEDRVDVSLIGYEFQSFFELFVLKVEVYSDALEGRVFVDFSDFFPLFFCLIKLVGNKQSND